MKLTPAQVSDIYNKLRDHGLNRQAEEFFANPEAYDFSRLENDPNFTDKFGTVDDLIADKYKIMQNLWNLYEGKKVSQTRFETLKQKYPFLDKKELDAWFDKSNQYKEQFIKERQIEAGKKRRELEIKNDWGPIQNLLASDYSKQRYIDNPEASLFGKEGKEGKWWQRGDDISDVTFGAAGAVGDLIPGVGGSFVGPATRTLRDVYHVAYDSPYQKDASQIGRDFFSDAAINVGTSYLPTMILNRGAKLTRNISKTESLLRDAGEVRLANQSKQSVNESLKQLNTKDIYNKSAEYVMDYPTLEKKIRDLPDGPMKQDLEALTRRGATQSEIAEHLTYWESVGGDIPSTAYYKGTEVSPYWSTTPVGGYVAEQAKAGTRGKVAHILAGGAEVARKAGEPLVKEYSTYTGRGSEPTKRETKVERALKDNQKDWYKTNYERDWEMGFVPNKVDGDPLWEAYKEWKEGK